MGIHWRILNKGERCSDLFITNAFLASVEARDAAKHPKMHSTAPTTKNYLVQNVNSHTVKKSCSYSGLVFLLQGEI